MNTFTLKLGGLLALVVLVVLAVPTGAQAYRFVDSNAARVSDNTYLLTHTYTAGFLNEDALMPIVATQDYETDVGYPRVGFSVEGNAAALQGAEINAMVLSNAPIVDNQYQATAGSRETFVLFTLVTLQNPVSATDDISLAFRTLPYSYTRDGEERTGSYNLEATAEVTTDDLIINAGK